MAIEHLDDQMSNIRNGRFRDAYEACSRDLGVARTTLEGRQSHFASHLVLARIMIEFSHGERALGHLALADRLSVDEDLGSEISRMAAWLAPLHITTEVLMGRPLSTSGYRLIQSPTTDDSQRWIDIFKRFDYACRRSPEAAIKSALEPDWSACPEVLILELRQLRTVLRAGQISAGEKWKPTNDFWEELSAAVKRFPRGEDYDDMLGMVPVHTSLSYYQAGLRFDSGNLGGAYEAIKVFRKTQHAERHVAGHLLYHRLLDLAGVGKEFRKKELARSLEQLRSESFRADHGAFKVAHIGPLATLSRHRAALKAETSAERGVAILERAAASRGPAASQSAIYRSVAFDLIRFRIQVGGREEVVGEALRMLQTFGLEDLVPLFNTTLTARNAVPDHSVRVSAALAAAEQKLRESVSSPVENLLRLRAVVLVLSDVQRSIGNVPCARAWCRALLEPGQFHGGAVSRLMSLFSTVGLPREALNLYETHAGTLMIQHRRLAGVERGKSLIGEGDLQRAREQFDLLTGSNAASVVAEAFSGMVDVERGQRRRQECIELYKMAETRLLEVALGPIDPDTSGPPPEAHSSVPYASPALDSVLLAVGWAELQLGDPVEGLAICLDCLHRRRYEVGAWVGLARSLRLLGRHRDAIDVLNQLLSPRSLEEWEGRHSWLESPSTSAEGESGSRRLRLPQLLLAHETTLRAELGWAFLDIRLNDRARQEFRQVVTRSAHHLAANRGLVLAASYLCDVDLVLDEVWRARKRIRRSVGFHSDSERDVLLEAVIALMPLEILPGAQAASDRFLARIRKDLRSRRRSESTQRRVFYALASAAYELRDFSRAEHYERRLKRLDQTKSTPTANEKMLLLEVRARLARRETKEAIKAFEKHLELCSKDDPECKFTLSDSAQIGRVIAYFEDRDFEAALEKLEEGIAPTNLISFDRTKLPQSYVRKAIRSWILLSLSEYPYLRSSERAELISRAKLANGNEDVSSVDGLHLRAIIEARLNLTGKSVSIAPAIADLDEAVRRAPLHPPLWRDLAALRLVAGKYQVASSDLRAAGGISKYDPRVSLVWGVLALRVGEPERAVGHFATAVQYDSADYAHHRALAITNLQLGRLTEALRVINEGLASLGADSTRYRLILLRARVRSEIAAQKPPATAKAELDRAIEELDGEISEVSEDLVLGTGRGETAYPIGKRILAELTARRAFLMARRGDRLQAHADLAKAAEFIKDEKPTVVPGSMSDPESSVPEISYLRTFLGERSGSDLVARGLDDERTSRVLGGVAWFVMALYLFGFTALRLREHPVGYPGALDLVPAAVLGMLALALTYRNQLPSFGNRLRRLQVNAVGAIELDRGPLETEVVHVDLDLSGTRLLEISGFSNHRPRVMLDEVDFVAVEPME